MSTLAQFIGGSPIKSIQRGVFQISMTGSSVTGTISAVDTTKTVVNFLGNSFISSSTLATIRADLASMAIYIALASSTSIVATRFAPGASGITSSISYEVIEYN